MQKLWLVAGLALGLSVASFAPALVHADEVGFNVNMGADDEAHFHFGDGHHHDPMIFRAAQRLQDAKHILWNDRRHNGPAKHHAIQLINQALDQLSWIESHR
jgi:hypothetical protein